MKKDKGFTLIELLAVIIILGVLMIIAIPSVAKYIDDSRKSGYISTAKELVGGARNLIHSGNLELADKDTTYYIDGKCIKTDNGYKSPYGEFEKAYVIIAVSNDNYEYFWISVDDSGKGIKKIVNIDKLDLADIESNISISDISTDKGIDNRSKIVVIDENCQSSESEIRTGPKISSITGEDIKIICKRAKILHTKTCQRNAIGCGVAVGEGNTITYGTIPGAVPKAGDAYDCDVNNDGTYDNETERFYYIGDIGDNASLIHYTNVNDQTTYAYDSLDENWHGPREAYKYLPNISDWSNELIIAPGTRQIVAHNGETSVEGKVIDSFTYTNKAARFLTTQEVEKISGYKVEDLIEGFFDGYEWLYENLGYFEGKTGAKSNGYWFETPNSEYDISVWAMSASFRFALYHVASNSTYVGVRPVITVKKINIE